MSDATPRIETIRPGGPNKPYEVFGVRYTPLAGDAPLQEQGLASWYGTKFHGRPTASGEPYDMFTMTAAHKTMPLPSYARVRNPANGREIIVRVNDRGPFHAGRVIDLSYTAALKLGVLNGVAPVEVERLTHADIRAGLPSRPMTAAAPAVLPTVSPTPAPATTSVPAPVAAQEPPPTPDRPLADAAQEARAQALFNDIRCVVCQHESIADSPAGIAADMRSLVREEIAAGRSDQQVRDDLVRRYGDFVLFTPPLRLATWLLWFGPVAALLAVGAVLLTVARRRRSDTPPLTPAEEADLARILADQAVRPDPDAKPSDD